MQVDLNNLSVQQTYFRDLLLLKEESVAFGNIIAFRKAMLDQARLNLEITDAGDTIAIAKLQGEIAVRRREIDEFEGVKNIIKSLAIQNGSVITKKIKSNLTPPEEK